MSIRTRNIHFTNWAKVIEALADKGVTVADESAARTFLIEANRDANPYYYYVGYIKDTQEIYTHGKFYNCTGYDDSELRGLLQDIEDSFSEQITTLQNEIEENEKVTSIALTELHANKADKSDLKNIDLSKYVDFEQYNNDVSNLQSTIDSNYTTLDNNKANASDLTSLSAEVEENEEVTAAALTYLHETKVDKSELPDFSEFATKTDLNTKQDLLVSGTNIKTVNNLDITGSGNIETPDTKVTSVDNHYKTAGVSAQSTIGFATDVIYDAAGHITGLTARSITESDIPEIDASKISKGTISIDRLPHGALERIVVVSTDTERFALTTENIQAGDTVKVTETGTMYFVVDDSKLNSEEGYEIYTAGTATAVNWSGIVSKPEGIDNWGSRISAIEGTYATQSWVGNNYLAKSGGTITTDALDSFTIHRNNGAYSVVHFYNTQDGNMTDVGYLGAASDGRPVYLNSSGSAFDLIHSSNIGSYNAGSATKLQTSRTIWGQSFDGTGNVNGQMTNHDSLVIDAADYYNSYWSRGLVFLANGVEAGGVYGCGAGKNLSDITITASGSRGNGQGIMLFKNGNVSIGGSTASAKLHVYGDAKVDGKLQISSSENAPLVINQAFSSSWANAIILLNGGLATGQHYTIDIGRAASSKNLGYLSFYYAADKSNDNRLSLGLHSMDDVVNIFGSGNVSIGNAQNTTANEKLHVHGNVKATSFIGNLTGNADSAKILNYTHSENINYSTNTPALKLICDTASIWESQGFPSPYCSGISAMTDYVGWQMVSYGGDKENPYFRSLQDNGTWKAWKQLAFLTDNVASATKLQTARTIWGQSFDGTGNISGLLTNVDGIQGSTTDGGYIGDRNKGLGATDGGSMIYNYSSAPITFHINGSERMRITSGGNVAVGGTTADYKLHVHGVGGFKDGLWAQGIRLENTDEINSYGSMGGTGNGNLHLNYRSSGIVSIASGGGNVAIGGTTADELLHVYGHAKASLFKSANGYTLTSSSATHCGLVPNSVITSSGNSSDFWLYNTASIKYQAANHAFLDGNVAINGHSASEKLHVHGNILATGTITSNSNFYGLDFCTTSDNRLKDFTKDVEIDFENLKNIPKKYYYWKDKSMGEDLQIGTSAQELIKIYPECVYYNEKDDKYSVNYQKLSIVALAAIDKLHDRVKYLESKLND